MGHGPKWFEPLQGGVEAGQDGRTECRLHGQVDIRFLNQVLARKLGQIARVPFVPRRPLKGAGAGLGCGRDVILSPPIEPALSLVPGNPWSLSVDSAADHLQSRRAAYLAYARRIQVSPGELLFHKWWTK